MPEKKGSLPLPLAVRRSPRSCLLPVTIEPACVTRIAAHFSCRISDVETARFGVLEHHGSRRDDASLRQVNAVFDDGAHAENGLVTHLNIPGQCHLCADVDVIADVASIRHVGTAANDGVVTDGDRGLDDGSFVNQAVLAQDQVGPDAGAARDVTDESITPRLGIQIPVASKRVLSVIPDGNDEIRGFRGMRSLHPLEWDQRQTFVGVGEAVCGIHGKAGDDPGAVMAQAVPSQARIGCISKYGNRFFWHGQPFLKPIPNPARAVSMPSG